MGEVTSEHRVITIHNRLVRDRVPAAIEAGGATAEVRVLTNEELADALIARLTEEAKELSAAENDSDRLKELANLQEVLGRLVTAMGYQQYEVDTVQLGQRREHGSFSRRFWLESVTKEGNQ